MIFAAQARSFLRHHRAIAAPVSVAVRAYRKLRPVHEPVHPFDAEFGMNTGGLVGVARLRTGHANEAQAMAYYGSQPSAFRTAMRRWMASLAGAGQPVQTFTFVDIGCGKGRVLMLASEFPLQRIVGVELSPALVKDANENLRQWRLRPHACEQIEARVADVLEFPLPEGPTLLYLYNPFEAELFARWVQSLQPALASRTAPLHVMYMNPRHEALLAAVPGVELLWQESIAHDEAEASVSLIGSEPERVSLYRLA
ncbi:class I SAM-dependent methyltransferase [Granulicella cerasi]|nr:class I SAM-dependent methyltransferase [Granulicella cerasi]